MLDHLNPKQKAAFDEARKDIFEMYAKEREDLTKRKFERTMIPLNSLLRSVNIFRDQFFNSQTLQDADIAEVSEAIASFGKVQTTQCRIESVNPEQGITKATILVLAAEEETDFGIQKVKKGGYFKAVINGAKLTGEGDSTWTFNSDIDSLAKGDQILLDYTVKVENAPWELEAGGRMSDNLKRLIKETKETYGSTGVFFKNTSNFIDVEDVAIIDGEQFQKDALKSELGKHVSSLDDALKLNEYLANFNVGGINSGKRRANSVVNSNVEVETETEKANKEGIDAGQPAATGLGE